MENLKNEKYIYLGFIGHNANAFQKLFSEYTRKPNEYGYFLNFENYSELACNQGVVCHTNCFENEQDFFEKLYSKLLWFYVENNKNK